MNYIAVTLYHKTLNPATAQDVWERSTFPKALWHASWGVKTVQTESGLTGESTHTLRIFTRELLAIAPDDVIALGSCTAKVPKEIPPTAQMCRVTSITDARRGSPAMQHWKVVGT